MDKIRFLHENNNRSKLWDFYSTEFRIPNQDKWGDYYIDDIFMDLSIKVEDNILYIYLYPQSFKQDNLIINDISIITKFNTLKNFLEDIKYPVIIKIAFNKNENFAYGFYTIEKTINIKFIKNEKVIVKLNVTHYKNGIKINKILQYNFKIKKYWGLIRLLD